MRRKHTYGNASQVKCYADGGPAKAFKKGGKKKKKQSNITNYTAMSTRERQMNELGLKDGGKVKMKPHKPEKVKSPILEAQKAKGYGPGGPQTPGAKGTYPKRKK